MTQPLEHYIEHADELAQQVVNVWGTYTTSGDGDKLTPQFKSLFDKACRYRDAKHTADNHRRFSLLTKDEEIEEKETTLAFAEAYKALDDSVRGIEPLSRGAGG